MNEKLSKWYSSGGKDIFYISARLDIKSINYVVSEINSLNLSFASFKVSNNYIFDEIFKRNSKPLSSIYSFSKGGSGKLVSKRRGAEFLKGIDIILIDDMSKAPDFIIKDLIRFGIPIISIGAYKGFEKSSLSGLYMQDVIPDLSFYKMPNELFVAKKRIESLKLNKFDSIIVARNSDRRKFLSKYFSAIKHGISPLTGDKVYFLNSDRSHCILKGADYKILGIEKINYLKFKNAINKKIEFLINNGSSIKDINKQERVLKIIEKKREICNNFYSCKINIGEEVIRVPAFIGYLVEDLSSYKVSEEERVIIKELGINSIRYSYVKTLDYSVNLYNRWTLFIDNGFSNDILDLSGKEELNRRLKFITYNGLVFS